jgi:Spy/CpxP family protein refolding chaperone
MKYYVPFAYEKMGRIEIDDPEVTNIEEAMNAAEKKLEEMSVSEMESLSEYLIDSEEIDREGVVLDENGNICTL